jgi:hypothetical protein
MRTVCDQTIAPARSPDNGQLPRGASGDAFPLHRRHHGPLDRTSSPVRDMTRQDTPVGGTARPPLGNVLEQADKTRHEDIRRDIAQRLRKACSHLSDEDFAALVHKIVKVQLKSERGSRA